MNKERILSKYKLTDRQKEFIRQYTDPASKGFNHISNSIDLAGYTAKNKRTLGSQVMSSPRVTECLKEINQAHTSEQKVTLDWIKQEFIDLYKNCRDSKDNTNAKGCLADLTRMLGGFTDVQLNKTEPIAEISAEDEKELQELAREHKIKLSKTG